MPDYLFEFTAHIDESRRPENFPHQVYVREQYNGLQSDEDVKDLYNKRVKSMILNPGLIVFMNDGEVIETTLTFDQRVFIPWHMITFFHGRVKLITPPPAPESLLDKMLLPDMPPADKKETVQ